MPNLFVYIGKPGVGKTSLIKTAFPKYRTFDVFDFLVPMRNEAGRIPEELTIQGYQHLYQHLHTHKPTEDTILELGTNHPALNIEKIGNLRQTYIPHVFLCLASNDTCRARTLARSPHNNYTYDPAALERRLRRPFPDSHLGLLQEQKIPHTVLDMEKSLSENQQYLFSFIQELT